MSLPGGPDTLRQLRNAELLRELIEHSKFSALRWVESGQLDAPNSVTDIEKATGLATLAVHGEGIPDGGLRAKAVEHRAPDVVVIETLAQFWVKVGFRRARAIHDALVQVGRAEAPRPAREHDVMAVMDLGQVIEGSRLLGEWQPILSTVLLDVDVRCAVFAHRSELDEMAVGR